MSSSSRDVPPDRLRGRSGLLGICALILVVAACGSSSTTPTGPSGSGASTGRTLSRTRMAATPSEDFAVFVDGVAFNASFVSAVCSTPGPEIITIVGVTGSGASNTTLGFTALAQPGVHTIAAAQFTQSTMTVIAGGAGSGFMAFQTLGQGTITITSLSATSVAGTVNLVLVPTSGATTNRVVTGSFSVPITGAACTSPGGTFAADPLPGGVGGAAAGAFTTGSFTALIDGASFNGALGLTATITNGQLSVSGADNLHTLQLIVQGVQGIGTFPINSLSPTTAALAQNGTAQAWFAGATTGSGSITVSSLTATAVAGTFTLTVSSADGISAPRTITNGVFNVPLAGSIPVPPSIPTGPVPPTDIPAGLVATIDGSEWRPVGAVQAVRTAQGFVTIAAADIQARAFSIAIFASAAGTYSLDNPASHNALYGSGSQQWFTSRPGGGGSVTISSISTTRITGSFTMTLAPGPRNSDQRTLQATGTFDLPL